MTDVRRARVLFVLLGVLLAGACASDAPEPIVVQNNTVAVRNLTSVEWRQVEVWVNYYYRVTKPSMAAGEVLTIPLNAFVAGYGQRFDVRSQMVKTIEVKATTSSGAPVDLMFGDGPRR